MSCDLGFARESQGEQACNRHTGPKELPLDLDFCRNCQWGLGVLRQRGSLDVDGNLGPKGMRHAYTLFVDQECWSKGVTFAVQLLCFNTPTAEGTSGFLLFDHLVGSIISPSYCPLCVSC